MLSNMKLNSKNKQSRFLKSDNKNTYFTISNNTDKEDGLWSYGFHIFNGIYPDDITNKIENKTLYPSYINIHYTKKYNLNIFLFHTGKGFLVEFINKNIISLGVKKYCIILKMDTDYQILEKNIKNLVIEYSNPEKKGFQYKKIYVSISLDLDYSINKTEHNEDNLAIYIEQSAKTGKEPLLYFRYDNDYDNLRKELDKNLVNINNLKEEIKDTNLKNTRIINIEDKHIGKALTWSLLSSDSFIMHDNNETGIWAGYPWFNNIWGRDIFISITGICLVQGKYTIALDILKTISKYQCIDKKSNDYGKIPNVIFSKKEILYNSADATPLFIRSVYEYYLYTGDIKAVMELWSNIDKAVNVFFNSVQDNDCFFLQNDAEDWMDAKFNENISYSNRGVYTVEIQALWYIALQCAYKLAEFIVKEKADIKNNNEYIKLSENCLKKSKELHVNFKEKFLKDSSPFIIDSLDKEKKPKDKVRPNGLLAIYYSELHGITKLIDNNHQLKYLNYIIPKVIFKHGVSTLSKDDDFFHPVHIHENYNKDSSYHNGCIWQWLSGAFISLCCKFGMENFCFEQTNILSNIILEKSTLGSLGELIDPYLDNEKSINESGAFSQAWSVSEYIRSFIQDYIGVKQNFAKRKLYIAPSLPEILENVKTIINFGSSEKIQLSYRINKRSKLLSHIEIKGIKIEKKIKIYLRIKSGKIIINNKKYSKILNIKCIINKSDDSIRMNFDILDNNNFKVKELINYGNSELCYLKIKKEDNYGIDENNIKYCENIKNNELNKIKTIINKNYIESVLK